MNNKYPFLKYVTGDSKVHLMNSKMKIIWFIISFIDIILIKDYTSLLVMFLFLSIIILNTKINLFAYFSNVIVICPLYIIILLITFAITINVLLSIMIALKLVLIVLLILILTFTTSLSEIAWGFECTFSKLKKIGFPVSKISLRIAMDIKFVSTMFEESKVIRKSMAYRGVAYHKNLFKSFRKMFFPVISLSYKVSRRMSKVMRLRFYGKSKRRTNYHDNKVTMFDKILIVIPIIIIYITIWLGWC